MKKQHKIEESKLSNFALYLNKVDAFDAPSSKESHLTIKKLSTGNTKANRKPIPMRTIDGQSLKFLNSLFWTNIMNRQVEFAKSVCASIIALTFAHDWRMVVGLGNPSVYEASMTLHHTYGFPYIPGSAIKGVVRNWVINKHFNLTEAEQKGNEEEWSQLKENKALQDEGFCQLFGCPKDSGRKTSDDKALAFIGDLIFFDAYPTASPNIAVDVMTMHYEKYYSEKDPLPPADWYSPNPIPFLTLKSETNKLNKFQFIVGLRKGAGTKVKIGQDGCAPLEGDILSIIGCFLKQALTQHGIGAKTAVGYGYMKG